MGPREREREREIEREGGARAQEAHYTRPEMQV